MSFMVGSASETFTGRVLIVLYALYADLGKTPQQAFK